MPPVGVSSTEHRARRGFQDVVVGQHRMELSSRDGRGSNGGSSRDAIIPTDRSASPPNGGGGNSSDATRGGMDACEEESAVHPELQRQSLVENLIGMGFPVEWAIRAAESSGKLAGDGLRGSIDFVN